MALHMRVLRQGNAAHAHGRAHARVDRVWLGAFSKKKAEAARKLSNDHYYLVVEGYNLQEV